MSIIYNGTEIENITYNSTVLDTVNYNNTEVFSGTKTLTVNKGSYIKNIIIDGTTYTSNTTVSIKPGTSVTLNCNIEDEYVNSYYQAITPYFVNWTGYTINSNQLFTFTMPNSNITYTANGNHNTSTSYTESNILYMINNNMFSSGIVGRTVALKKYSSTHNWIIIRANKDSYDLWYADTIGTATWRTVNGNQFRWLDQSKNWHTGSDSTTDNPRYLCDQFRFTLSTDIRSKLISNGLNVNCGEYDKVVILSAKQLGATFSGSYSDDDNTAIPYFNSDSRRNIGAMYWTNSIYSSSSTNGRCMLRVGTGGKFATNTYDYTGKDTPWNVVPAIRVG